MPKFPPAREYGKDDPRPAVRGAYAMGRRIRETHEAMRPARAPRPEPASKPGLIQRIRERVMAHERGRSERRMQRMREQREAPRNITGRRG